MLNGAAARLAAPGDEVIIVASEYLDSSKVPDLRAKVVTFRDGNVMDRLLTYRATTGDLPGTEVESVTL
jgi:aspartate 1-decarboxylase